VWETLFRPCIQWIYHRIKPAILKLQRIMKRFLLLLSVILSATPLHAQKDLENNEVFVTVGADVPMYNGIESDVIIGIH